MILLPPVLACVGATASYGISYVYMGRYLTNRGIPPLILSASQLGVAAILLAFAIPVAGRQTPLWRLEAVSAVLILGVLGCPASEGCRPAAARRPAIMPRGDQGVSAVNGGC